MGPKSGQATIHVNELNLKSSILPGRPEDHSETIQVSTIADFVAEHNLPRIDFLKIDTEGYDLEVLAGAAPLLEQQRIHMILTECELVPRSEHFVRIEALAEFLRRFRYELLGIYEQTPDWEGDNFLSYCNALFVSEKLRVRGGRLQ